MQHWCVLVVCRSPDDTLAWFSNQAKPLPVEYFAVEMAGSSWIGMWHRCYLSSDTPLVAMHLWMVSLICRTSSLFGTHNNQSLIELLHNFSLCMHCGGNQHEKTTRRLANRTPLVPSRTSFSERHEVDSSRTKDLWQGWWLVWRCNMMSNLSFLGYQRSSFSFEGSR